MDSFIAVKTCTTKLDAEVVKTHLEAHKIPAYILGDDESRMYAFPFQTTPKGVRVFVRQTDVEKAKKLLE